MTARTPYQAGGGDVSATLGELERKLRELEQELNAAARPANGAAAAMPEPASAAPSAPAPQPPSAPTPAPTPAPAPAPTPAPQGRDADALIAQARARLGGQVDELLRFREQLHRTARELEDEYSRVLARIGAPATPAAPAAAPPAPVRAPIAPAVDESAFLPSHPDFPQPDQTLATPVVAPQSVAPMHQVPVAAVPPAPAPAPVAASPYEDTPFEGAIVIDAGPFTDIAALSAFEQGLAHVPGAEDVYVSGFEGNRAIVELRLAQPVALVREMRQAVPIHFTITDAAAGRLRLDVTAIASGS
jgi:hypothetical protein